MSVPTTLVDIAFATDPGSTPTWVDVSAYVRAWSISRGRQHELDIVQAGRAGLLLDNQDGRFDPNNSAGPYYPNVRPMRRIRIRATFDAVTYDLFYGYIETWPQVWDKAPTGDATVTIEATDAFTPLALANVTTTRSAELSGTRIGAVLDAISWSSADRAIDAGKSTVQAATLTNEGALTHLQDVALTEGGLLFASRDGKVTFLDRTKFVTSALDIANLTWGDSGAEKRYQDIVVAFDESQIWNDVTVQATGLTDQTASDATSQARYFRRSRVDSTLHTAEAEMNDRADYVVARYKEPDLRIISLVPNALAEAAQWSRVLARDLHDKVRVIRRPPSGGTITQDSFIEGITYAASPQDWETTWDLTPVSPLDEFWILGTSPGGTSTRLYW